VAYGPIGKKGPSVILALHTAPGGAAAPAGAGRVGGGGGARGGG
jgi:hypothetical protein